MRGLSRVATNSVVLDRMRISASKLTDLPGAHLLASSSQPSPSALAAQLDVRSVAAVSDVREANGLVTQLVVHSSVLSVVVLRMITLEQPGLFLDYGVGANAEYSTPISFI